MKDSGVEWIGGIPESWEVVKLGRFLDRVSTGLNPRNNFVLGDGNNFYVTIKNFKHGKLFLDNRCDKISDEAKSLINKRSDLKEGDLLFASISKTGDAYLIKTPPLNWDINESVFTIRTNKKYLLPEFLFHAITSSYFYEKLLSEATGTTFKSIKMEKLKNNNLLCPPLHEQQAIANYLDDQVSRLDQLIADQQRVIEEWKAYKQSLITETVTKGLNPEVAFKDSGIEWIGEIPSHWEVIRLRTIGKTKSGLSNKTKEDFGIGNPFVSYGDVYRRDIIKATDFVNSTIDDISKFAINRGDVLFTGSSETIAELGMSSVALENIENSTYSGFLIRFRPESNKLLPEFSRFLFRSLSMREYLIQDDRSVTRSNLSQKKLKDMPTILPPLHEQQQIADFLDEKCSKIDQLIENKQRLIEDLKAYKQSLIYECVTGKKEIV